MCVCVCGVWCVRVVCVHACVFVCMFVCACARAWYACVCVCVEGGRTLQHDGSESNGCLSVYVHSVSLDVVT